MHNYVEITCLHTRCVFMHVFVSHKHAFHSEHASAHVHVCNVHQTHVHAYVSTTAHTNITLILSALHPDSCIHAHTYTSCTLTRTCFIHHTCANMYAYTYYVCMCLCVSVCVYTYVKVYVCMHNIHILNATHLQIHLHHIQYVNLNEYKHM